jgi:predicted dehydrogenase
METKKICVIGGGKWGRNHIRTLHEMGNLVSIVESNEVRLKDLLSRYPVKGFSNIDEAIADDFNGFVLATPAETHYSIGKKLLENGCNTLIEKPMTLCSEDSEKLIEIAKKNNARLMVGHILLFHPAIRKIRKLVKEGKIGRLYYLYSNRLNMGTVRTEENVFWSFAPHDISVLDFIVGQPPIEIHSKGGKYLQDTIDDITITQFDYPDNIKAHIFVSWIHPFKEQRLVVVGSRGMLAFDDSSTDRNILFYNKRIDWNNNIPTKIEEPDEIIDYKRSQPLENELKYFIDNLDKRIEIADGESGLEVVRVLEKAQKFLDVRSLS